MKKLFLQLMAVAIAACTFTACEDVPEPYNNPYANGVLPNAGSGSANEVAPDPAGSGTAADPYNVAKALQVCAEVGEAGTTTAVYARGYVIEISEISTQYGNATFKISDTKGGANALTVYRAKGLNNEAITDEKIVKDGDLVVITGNLVNYKGNTPEFTQGCYIVSINEDGGSTDEPGDNTDEPTVSDGNGTAASPYSITGALAAATGNGVYVKGFIVGNVEGQSIQSGAQFSATGDSQTNILVAASADETDVEKCMPVQLPSGTVRSALNLKDNPSNYKKEVTLYGNIEKYFSVTGLKTVTFAILDGQEIGVNPDGGTTPTPTGDAKGSGTQADPWNVAAAIAAIKANNTPDEAFVKGVIVQLDNYNSQYGSCTYWISDDANATNKLQVYSGLNLNKEKFTALSELAIGDEVVVAGKLKDYNGTPEFDKNNYIVSITKAGDNGGNTPAGDNYKAVATIADGNYVIGAAVSSTVFVAVPLESSKTYGYLGKDETTLSNEGIATSASNEFTFKATNGGYTIQLPDGRYLYMKGDYNSFNVDATAPASGHVWTVSFGSDNTASIVNVLTGKTIQYSVQYSSYGAYSSITNVLPVLYKK